MERSAKSVMIKDFLCEKKLPYGRVFFAFTVYRENTYIKVIGDHINP